MIAFALTSMIPTITDAFSTVGSHKSYVVYRYFGSEQTYMVTLDCFEEFLADEVPF